MGHTHQARHIGLTERATYIDTHAELLLDADGRVTTAALWSLES